MLSRLVTFFGYVFILEFGIVGVALARLLTLMLMATAVTWFARKQIRFSINWSLISRVAIASLLMGILIKWIPMDSWDVLMLKIAVGITVFTFFLIVFRVATKKNFVELKSQF